VTVTLTELWVAAERLNGMQIVDSREMIDFMAWGGHVLFWEYDVIQCYARYYFPDIVLLLQDTD